MTPRVDDEAQTATEDDIRRLYSELARRAEVRDWYCENDFSEALKALQAQPTSAIKRPLAINTNPADGSVATLGRDGDVILGFYLDEDAPKDVEVSLTIGGTGVRGCPITLRPGEMTPFFGDAASCSRTDFFPIMAVNYSETHVHGDPEALGRASAIYGFLPSAARRWVATSSHALPGGAMVCHGYFGYGK